MKYLIGTDIGTSGTKTIIMDENGELISKSWEGYSISVPKALWAEQNAEVWETAVYNTISDAVKISGISPSTIAGICISGLYGGSGVPCDKDFNPVRPCIIWMDRRSHVQSQNVLKNVEAEELFQTTRNGSDPYYGYLKMLWIRDNEPEKWEKIQCFLPPNSYCIQKLTGKAAIDYTSAGNIGGFFDADKQRWSDELIAKLGMDKSKLPERIVESSDVVGTVTKEAAVRLGIDEGTPVCAGGVDCVVATLGLGVTAPGQHVAIIGTSMTWGYLKSELSTERRLISMPYVINPKEKMFIFGGAATAAAINKWLRDNVAFEEMLEEKAGLKSAYELMDEQAAKISAGSDGLIVLPYFMGERSPLWDTNAKGTIFGLTLNHTKAHLYRAFLEAVAYSLKDTMQNIEKCDLSNKLVVSGGVAKSPLWKQIFADVTGCEVITPLQDIEANFGDVILAGLGTNTITLEKAMSWVKFSEPVTPNPKSTELYDKYFKIYKALYNDLRPRMEEINKVVEEGL